MVQLTTQVNMKAYAIKDPKGEIVIRTITFWAKDSRKSFVDEYKWAWSTLYKIGYRCVPVEILEINKEKV